MTIEECFCNSDSDYLSCLVNLFSRNPNRLHYESNFLNDMNFLQSTNFLRIWVCNLSVPLVTSGDMTSGALRRNNLVEEASQYRTGWISTLKLSFPPLKSPARIIFILIIKLRIHCYHRIVSVVLDIMFYVS